MGKVLNARGKEANPKKKKPSKKMPPYLKPWVCQACKGGGKMAVVGEHGRFEGECISCKGTGWMFNPNLMLGIAVDIMADMGKILHFLQQHIESKEVCREIGKILVNAGDHALAVTYYFNEFLDLPENIDEFIKAGPDAGNGNGGQGDPDIGKGDSGSD